MSRQTLTASAWGLAAVAWVINRLLGFDPLLASLDLVHRPHDSVTAER